MEETKKNNSVNSGGIVYSKKKERHMVSWTPEEDDILRQQISLHGTDNWVIIASKFKDKTTRQCRRRWYTYLNSDFKKGGWSPEEDVLLCEAQRIFGNRWTEIAKIVSGRTDNAVKNRFTTLCKKRAKYEALVKENNNGIMKSNNERLVFNKRPGNDATEVNAPPAKRTRRSHLPDYTENCFVGDRSHPQSGNQQLRPPFAVLAENFHVSAQRHLSSLKEISADAQNSKIQGTFLRKDDPKVTALFQQAELLSSLALKINTENTEHSLENAWKVLQDFLSQSKENDTPGIRFCEVDIQLENFKYLVEDLISTNDGSQPSWRHPDLDRESPASSEYSTGSTLMPYIATDNIEVSQAGIEARHNEIGSELQVNNPGEGNIMGKFEEDNISSAIITEGVGETLFFNDQTNDDKVISASSSAEFGSPLQVTPLFRSLAAAIPSPKFSESERSFLLKTLGVESPCPSQCLNPSQPPSCKRALLQSI